MVERRPDTGEQSQSTKGAVNRDQEIKRSTAVTGPGETSVTEDHELSMDPTNFTADGGDLSVESLKHALDEEAKKVSQSDSGEPSMTDAGKVVRNPSLKH